MPRSVHHRANRPIRARLDPQNAKLLYDLVKEVAALGKLADLGFTRRFADEPGQWEVRRIIKARLPAADARARRNDSTVNATQATTPSTRTSLGRLRPRSGSTAANRPTRVIESARC